jgi:hypothetical protein
MNSKDYEILGKDIGTLVKSKQKAYGDSFGQSHKILKVLFPNGINTDQYIHALVITRIVDKLFRIANDPCYGGESPYADITGYGLLGLMKHLEQMDEKVPSKEQEKRLDG